MNIKNFMDQIENYFQEYIDFYDKHEFLVLFIIMIIAFYPILKIFRKIISPVIRKLSRIKGESYQIIIEKYDISTRVLHVFGAIYIVIWGDLLGETKIIPKLVIQMKNIAVSMYLVTAITFFILTLIDIVVGIYRSKSGANRVSIGLHMQIIKLIITICAVLAAFSLSLGVSVKSLFTSIGAAAALLTFVFKDTLLGLTASLQLTLQDLVRVGDWVTVPKYNADGDVEQINITIVVIRNFDNTTTIIPTSGLLDTSVKNYRSMFENSGRRIKRAININMYTVKICDDQMLEKIKQLEYFNLIEPHFQMNSDKAIRGNATNLALFRKYVNQYLRHHSGIHQDGFTFLVRQLMPTAEGIPIEIYVFTKDSNWAKHEDVQSDIFDHLFAVMPLFDLKPFQRSPGVIKTLKAVE